MIIVIPALAFYIGIHEFDIIEFHNTATDFTFNYNLFPYATFRFSSIGLSQFALVFFHTSPIHLEHPDSILRSIILATGL